MFTYNGRQYFLSEGTGAVQVADAVTREWIMQIDKREECAAREALISGDKARCYAWGRQDAGESQKDSGVAQRFGEEYAAHVYRFRIGDHWNQSPLQDAYGEWLAGELPCTPTGAAQTSK